MDKHLHGVGMLPSSKWPQYGQCRCTGVPRHVCGHGTRATAPAPPLELRPICGHLRLHVPALNNSDAVH